MYYIGGVHELDATEQIIDYGYDVIFGKGDPLPRIHKILKIPLAKVHHNEKACLSSELGISDKNIFDFSSEWVFGHSWQFFHDLNLSDYFYAAILTVHEICHVFNGHSLSRNLAGSSYYQTVGSFAKQWINWIAVISH